MWPTMWLPHSHKIWSTTEQAQYKQNMNSQTPHMTNIYICYHTMRYWEEGQGLIKRTETEYKRNGNGRSSRHAWHLIFLIFIPLGDTLKWCLLQIALSLSRCVVCRTPHTHHIPYQYSVPLATTIWGRDTERDFLRRGKRESRKGACLCSYVWSDLCVYACVKCHIMTRSGMVYCKPPDPPTRD